MSGARRSSLAPWRPVLWLLESGAVAQLGERLICIQEVVGSTPIGSIPEAGGQEPGARK